MKKKLGIPIVMLTMCSALLVGCSDETTETKQEEHSFSAKIIEIDDSTVVVQPIKNMTILNQSALTPTTPV